MKLNPYLSFNGQCATAFKFYEQLLGGKITFIQKWGDSPAAAHVPSTAQDFIMHATLEIKGAVLMGADSPDNYQKPQGMNVVIHCDSTAEAKRVFDGLAAGGTVQMPFDKTFFAAGFGMCEDKFGIPWMVITQQA